MEPCTLVILLIQMSAFARHNDGEGGQYTKSRRPVTLILLEQFDTLECALRRERQIKRWTREKKLALAAGDLGKLRVLAKRRKR